MSTKTIRQHFAGYAFIFPAFLLLAVVTVFPYLDVVFLSFQKTSYGVVTKFVGLKNFINVLKDSRFLLVIKNQALIIVISGFFQVFLGFSGALALSRSSKGSYLLRSIILIPYVIPGVVSGLLWKWILDGNSGVLNMLLVITGLSDEYIPFLSDSRYALACIIIVNIWRIFPFMMVMYLSGLQGIPEEQYEAACMDGATKLQRLRYVTLPNMRPIIVLTVILATIWNFKIFDIVWVLTKGGPANASEVFSTLIYKSSFFDMNFGFASAAAVIMAIIISIPIFLNLRHSKNNA